MNTGLLNTAVAAGIAGAVLASACGATAAGRGSDDQGWTARLGAAVRFAPKYEGGGRYQFGALPIIDVTLGKHLFVNVRDGVGLYAWNADGFKLGAAIGYAPGRKENDGSRLRGMGDIDAAARAAVIGSYSFDRVSLSAKLSRDIGGSEGVLGTVGAGYKLVSSSRFGLTIDGSTTWADKTYMKDRFGVSPEQSYRSGNARYSPDSGFKDVTLGLGSTYGLTENWALVGSAGVSVLMNKAANSPVVEDKSSFFSTLGAAYQF